MIPKFIKLEHILLAISSIDREGVPKGRESSKYDLSYKGRLYPPKYVIALAHKFVTGDLLSSNDFSGGITESNRFLQTLGFTILLKKLGSPTMANQKSSSKVTGFLPIEPTLTNKRQSHNERCPDCKVRVEQLLSKLYGRVIHQYPFEIAAHPKDFSDPDLLSIYKKLTAYRGFQDLTRSSTLREVDFYLPDQRFIVEFDESQHFTIPRKIALENYPKEILLGFDKSKWIQKCNLINRTDNNPPFRDEQRAWYDTIRDFLPRIFDLNPTVRLFANDLEWCQLDPENPNDLRNFKAIIEAKKLETRVSKIDNPNFGRIVIARDWQGNVEEAKTILRNVASSWPSGYKVDFLVTCGAFIQFPWPNLSRVDIGDNKNPNPFAINQIIQVAKKSVGDLLTDEIKDRLKTFVNYVTIGIDSYKTKISTTKNHIGDLHVELVCVFDLVAEKEYWTGKSYPTTSQESGLVRITDYNSHFLTLKDLGCVMVLGCHDLSAFNNRNWSKTGYWRKEIKLDFRRLAEDKKPTYIIHHPHTTVKVRTWLNSWSFINQELPYAKYYIGTGRYNDPDRDILTWDDLGHVLRTTKKGESIDFIIR